MYFGLCVRVLVLSLLTFEQHANALNDRSGSFDHPRNHKPDFASNFERSAQPRGFLGSSGSSHNGGGKVDSYSPEGSVSSYGFSSLNIGKPTQNSKQPPQTNHNANGVIEATAGMWEVFSPIGGVWSPKVQPGSPSTFNPKQPGYTSLVGYQPKPQKPSFSSKPQQGVLQSKAGMWDNFSPDAPNVQPGPPPKKPSFPPKPQQGVLQTKAGMWDIFSPDGNGPNVQPGSPPQLRQIVYRPQQAGYQPSVYHLKPKPKQPGYQPSIYQLKLLPGYPLKPSFPPNPQQGVLQTKAGMWDFHYPNGGVSDPEIQPGTPPKKPSFPPQQGVPQTKASMQPRSPSPTQQGVFQTKAGVLDIFSSVGISSPNVKPGFPSQQSSYQPSVSVHQPSYQPQLIGIQSKAGIWEFFSPNGRVSGPNVEPANLNKEMTVPPGSPHRPRWQQSLVPV